MTKVTEGGVGTVGFHVKIGLETHVQPNTQTKIFCGCRNPVNLKEEPEPNTLTCPTCLGLPGSKPRTNKKLIEIGTKVAIALNCKVNENILFSRKTYFYPDMSKNYQITQFEIPLGEDGFLEIDADGNRKKIRIKRVHIEEDPGKTVHIGGLGGKYTLIDYNRSGTPLLEIVTEPDFSSSKEARIYLNKLITIMEYLGVYDSSSLAVVKSDANISLEGSERVEVKNITGTREIEQSLNYEIVRQNSVIRQGSKVKRGTRSWNPDMGSTVELRGKEQEAEYGYILDPDLAKIEITKNMMEDLNKNLPELPDKKYQRFLKDYKLQPKLAESLVSEKELADLFESISKKVDPKLAASWIAGYLKKTLNWHNLKFKDSGVKQEWMLELLEQFKKGLITDRNAEQVIRKMVEEKKPPSELIKKHGLAKDEVDLSTVLNKVLASNKKAVEDYKNGEEKAVNFLVGLVMKETKGQVDANEIRKELLKKIK